MSFNQAIAHYSTKINKVMGELYKYFRLYHGIKNRI